MYKLYSISDIRTSVALCIGILCCYTQCCSFECTLYVCAYYNEMQRWCGLLLGHCWSSTSLDIWCTSLYHLQMSSKWGKNVVEVLAKMVWSSSRKMGRWRCRPTQALILCPEEDCYTSWSNISRFPACFKKVSENLLISTQQQPAEKKY